MISLPTSPSDRTLTLALLDADNANRQPFGLYTHPIHIATGYPGVADPTSTIAMINDFLDWAQQQANVWIVNNRQVLDWVRNPVPVSQLNTITSFQCALPVVSEKICNGIPSNEAGLLSACQFTQFPFYTCYGCPATPPTPSNPNPSQPAVSGTVRTRLPSNCYTAFWDPIGAKCLCQNGTSCQFNDQTRPIGVRRRVVLVFPTRLTIVLCLFTACSLMGPT